MLRRGLWVIAIASAVAVVGDLTTRALLAISRLTANTASIEGAVVHAHWTMAAAMAFAVAGAAIACAVGIGSPRRRWLVVFASGSAIAGACQLVAWIEIVRHQSILGDFTRRELQIGEAASAAGWVAFAVVAAWSDARPQLVRWLRIVVFLHLAVFAIGELGHRDSWIAIAEHASAVLRSLAAVFLALDLLGAFPRDDAAPAASIDVRARSFASAAAVGACVVGIAYAATALWLTQRMSTAEYTPFMAMVGMITFAAGAFVLRWMRKGRASIGRWIVATLVILVAGNLVLQSNDLPVEDIHLEAKAVPGLTVSLPVGRVIEDARFRDVGRLDVVTARQDLGTTTVKWGLRDRDPIVQYEVLDRDRFQRFVRGVEISGVGLPYGTVHASWQCPGDRRWFELELDNVAGEATGLRVLADRIFDTIDCQPTTIGSAPAFELAFERPGYAKVLASDPQRVMYAGRAGDVLTLARSMNVEYETALGTNPTQLLDLVHWGQHEDKVQRLAPIARDGDPFTHIVIEVIADGQRLVATAWRCSLTISIAAIDIGPASVPIEPVLEALRAARCPASP